MRLIGLHGRAGAGKDTAAELIQEAVGYPRFTVKRVAFADKMKQSGLMALGFTPEESTLELANAIKDFGQIVVSVGLHVHTIPGRKFWQLYGTEAHRDVFDQNFWVDALLPRPSSHPSQGVRNAVGARLLEQTFGAADIVCVTDVRFTNEASRILALGGEVWYVNAEERLGLLMDGHPSELTLEAKYITDVLYNNHDRQSFSDAITRKLNG